MLAAGHRTAEAANAARAQTNPAGQCNSAWRVAKAAEPPPGA
jgi:hypothetical protein